MQKGGAAAPCSPPPGIGPCTSPKRYGSRTCLTTILPRLETGERTDLKADLIFSALMSLAESFHSSVGSEQPAVRANNNMEGKLEVQHFKPV